MDTTANTTQVNDFNISDANLQETEIDTKREIVQKEPEITVE